MTHVAVLAGRPGTRLPPLTEQIPTPLVPVRRKPFLHHQFGLLKSFGPTEILLPVGYLGWKIEQYFGDGSRLDLHIGYSREQTPLGSAGARIRQDLRTTPRIEWFAALLLPGG